MIVLKLPGGPVAHAALSADGGRVAAVTRAGVWAADRAGGYAWRELFPGSTTGPARVRGGLAFHPGGDLLAWAWVDGSAAAFDFATGRTVVPFPPRSRTGAFGAGPQVLFSPDGSELWAVLGKRGRRTVGTWAALPAVALPFPHEDHVLVDATGRAVVGWSDAAEDEDGLDYDESTDEFTDVPLRVYSFRAAGGSRATVPVDNPSPDDPVATDPAGSLLAAGWGTGGTVYDAATGDERFAVRPRGNARLGALAFTPDGRTVLVGHGPRVRAFDTASWAERAALDWRAGPVTALAVSGDGLTAAAGTGTGRVVVWDLA